MQINQYCSLGGGNARTKRTDVHLVVIIGYACARREIEIEVQDALSGGLECLPDALDVDQAAGVYVEPLERRRVGARAGQDVQVDVAAPGVLDQALLDAEVARRDVVLEHRARVVVQTEPVAEPEHLEFPDGAEETERRQKVVLGVGVSHSGDAVEHEEVEVECNRVERRGSGRVAQVLERERTDTGKQVEDVD